MKKGYFGIGIWHTKTQTNVGTLWRSAYSFGADFIFTVGRRYKKQSSDTVKAWRHIPLWHFETTADLVAHLPLDCRLVGIELDDHAKQLPSYMHHDRACYILGAEDSGLDKITLAACQDLITIPGAAYCLNVAVAGSIVLYDRAAKLG